MNAPAAFADAAQPLRQLEAEIGKVLVGQRDLVRRLLIGLLCDAHLLLEGVPGLAKTTVVKTLAQGMAAKFSRVQFTPDLLPADIIGTRIYVAGQAGGQFTTRLGPIFAQIVLADEINRAPAKVQSALLEAMQERQVTIGDETFPLPKPFLVLATQNPLEQEGTYPLPEAQTDRFLMKVKVDYPIASEERQILDRALARDGAPVQRVLTAEALAHAQRTLDGVHMDDRIKDYCVALVRATRDPKGAGIASLAGMIDVPASPRATIALAMAARAQAFLEGRGFVTPQDVKSIAPDVLRHRLHPSYEAEAENLGSDALIQRLLEHVQVP
jgi:MoxR-like ATPase